MAQKDKIKELVGRSLNSYHTKSLQQIDRIEKKNKEQNHKISILSNELDNDYLTKTEEGSVISLEHSKEGMVYLDELQGNTLVNYCTDGSKEMTLNGDIDVEGISVTTTEGVDNGKVDVMCEGNTLVNLIEDANILFQKGFGGSLGTLVSTNVIPSRCCIEIHNVKPNVSYTIIPFNKSPYHGLFILDENNTNLITPTWRSGIYTFTTPANTNYLGFNFKLDENDTNFTNISQILENYLLIEGDWTNKETPPYFIGMKSVGQDDENGHKIEILSSVGKENLLLNTDTYIDGENSSKTFTFSKDTSILKGNTITLSCDLEVENIQPIENGKCRIGMEMGVKFEDDTIAYYNIWQSSDFNGRKAKTISIPDKTIKNIMYIGIYVQCKATKHRVGRPKIEIGDIATSWCPSTLDNLNGLQSFINKKEILLNEPLRGLPNGVKDRFVKIGNKWFIERNRDIREYQEGDLDLTDVITDMTNTEYSLESPIYEPLEINPELICYNDTTHISNNSIIPCNMKIKNIGYNAIIKPSTLYTVALDTNKSGTIGMNLGGVKGTTTNNVITLTTPATLTDDSLRLYGKGIKGSKVRLLEGDKTNWIPSFFEGMKSSFEDKVQDDGRYKIEVVSNNENLFNINELKESADIKKENGMLALNVYANYLGKQKLKDFCKGLKIGETYKFSLDFDKNGGTSNSVGGQIRLYNSELQENIILTSPFVYDNRFLNDDWSLIFYGNNPSTKCYFKNIQLKKSTISTNYVPYKSNKIQFSSIEPLRGVGNIKDKFIFKDGKLMIERNIKSSIIDGTEGVVEIHGGNKCMITKFVSVMNNGIDYTPISCDKLQVYTGRDIMVSAKNVNGICYYYEPSGSRGDSIVIRNNLINQTVDSYKEFLLHNPLVLNYIIKEPTYEEIPFELQKIILEGYENGTLFVDTNIPPTSTVTYAGETPIVKATKLNKTEVLNNTNDINDNIVPYLMDMDYRVVCLELATETQGISMARLFGGVYEMLKRDILSGRLSKEEYGYRLADYFNAGKLTEEQVRELEDLR